MNIRKILLSLLCLLIASATYAGGVDVKSFNDNWRFLKSDAKGAEQANFDDSQWQALDLPHDWAIEGPFSSEYNARCGGLPTHGTGWYRKSFAMEDSAKGKVVNVIFDGAMYDAYVWVNGQLVGNRPYGYVNFKFDISKYLKYDGSQNVMAVRLQPQDLSSRWYPGAGIYRNVWMSIDNPVHIPTWGTYVTTPTVTDAKAVVQSEVELANHSNSDQTVTVKYSVVDANQKVVATKSEEAVVPANGETTSGVWMDVANPQRWDIETPNMYSLKAEVVVDGKVIDTTVTPFGMRTIEFTTEGFYLNGRKVRFNGVCLHHDNGPIGTAFNLRADERKLQIMKDMGVNAIRTSHNPPAAEFLDLCDRMGLLVLDEAFDGWCVPKTENDYALHFDEWAEKDLTAIIKRDRNHPSIVMWSVGNEVLENMKFIQQNGWKIAKDLTALCKSLDPTRPSTMGYNYYPNPYISNIPQQVGVAGMNYKPITYDEIHHDYPQLKIYGSETSSCTSSRGVYHLPIEKYEKHESKQVTSYDIVGPSWAYPPDVEFDALEKFPYVMGQFMWTGFDYLGEPTPYGGRDNSSHGYWNDDWPARSSYFGAVDLCGLPKDRFYLYQSEWSSKPMVHLLPHWNWKGMEGEIIPVYAYTNCDEAELFVNGKSMGKRVKGVDGTDLKIKFQMNQDTIFHSKYRLSWDVPYKAGSIKVVAYKDGKAIVEKEIRTAGKPARIALAPDRNVITADGKDLSYVTVRIEDKDGNLCPEADNLVEFKIEGAGKLIAVGNGDATSIASFQAPNRKAFSGMCMAILQSDKNEAGQITITATSKGLKTATTVVSSK